MRFGRKKLGVYRKQPIDVGLKSLYTWMSWAVSLGKIYDLGEVMSDDSSLCKPGRGILAPPNKEIINRQIYIAKNNGIYGFAMYYYWF